jgi:hypothetical protein
MRNLLLVATICALTVTATAAATTPAADKASMEKRSRAFVGLLHACQAISIATVNAIQANPNDLITASGDVSKSKSICERVRHDMATGNTLHFRDQAIDCEIAVDYYTKGLGRLSDYLDGAKPSDAATAITYFQNASGDSRGCVREINARRAVYGLKTLPV